MMNEIMTSLYQLLDDVPLMLWASASVLLITLWISQRKNVQLQRLASELKQARNDLKALTTTSLGIGGRLREIERRARTIQEQPKVQHVDMYEAANQPYDYAIQLAHQGKEVDDIVTMCGISQNEAELIKMMHRLDEAS